MPETVTLRDVLDIVLDRVNDLAAGQRQLDDKHAELAKNQRDLIEATNHKIDELRKQGMRVLALVLAIGAPIVVNNWTALVTQVGQLF